jgi:hypothetical protein
MEPVSAQFEPCSQHHDCALAIFSSPYTHLSTVYNAYQINPFTAYFNNAKDIYVPKHIQGKFCDFEDYINKNRKLRINLGYE